MHRQICLFRLHIAVYEQYICLCDNCGFNIVVSVTEE